MENACNAIARSLSCSYFLKMVASWVMKKDQHVSQGTSIFLDKLAVHYSYIWGFGDYLN